MRLPSAVAVGPDGTVVVADGADNRLLQFNSEGNFASEIRSVGDENLLRSVSAHFDASGRLWIANTGRQRVLVRDVDGALARVIPIERGSLTRVPDVTDVFPYPDGQRAWLVDNDNNRLLLLDLQTGTQTVVGEYGEGLGQFQHPFLLALSGRGDLFVSDVINGRVQILSATGRPAGAISNYGADLGQIYRPGGVACDREGNVWIADAVLGVVQVFSPLGEFRDVVRDADEQPLKLSMPLGITLDAEGSLYVAEVSADRVRKFSMTINPKAPLPAKPPPPQTLAGQQGRACTLCHIEWLQAFAQGKGTVLLQAPPVSAEQPPASRSEMCLSCHNGAVADSRRRIWLEHGHGTDIVPPPNIQVPQNLPLVNGKIECRTCHSAHVSGAPVGDIRTAVFLRVPNVASALCIGCHRDKTRGPELGTHPTGGMPWPVPQSIIDAGGRVGPNPRELTCQVCHTPHGAPHEHLLVMGTETNQLCLTCHDQMRPGMFREGAAEHPLSPKVAPEQAEAVKEMSTKLSPDGRLICLSCHKLHHGMGKRFMLADELQDARFCLRCHEERRVMLGSMHDLRVDFPNEKNRLGMTPETGGPCSACHLFHRYARAPEFSEIDPGGKCVTCHQKGRVAQDTVLPPLIHPKPVCTNCHNPHLPSNGMFLAGKPVDVCSSCHPDQGLVMGGTHDITYSRAFWPAVSAQANDVCLACHRPHGDETTGLFRAGLGEGINCDDAPCAACHADAEPEANSLISFLHTRDAKNLKVECELPMSVLPDGTKLILCHSCHNPHGGVDALRALLRVQPGQTEQQICFQCHVDMSHIGAIGHGTEPLSAAGFDSDACKPCHTVHAAPDSVEARYLWPKKLAYPADMPEPVRVPDRPCRACHRTGGPVAPPAIATHPKADLFNPTSPGEPGFLPLFNDQGEVDPQGKHACRTCHLTHGRATAAPVPEALGKLSERELRARQWHIRIFGPGNVCETCHGFDALRRFMYFHDAGRRGGPIEQPARLGG
ncbi:MAG TPA: cytochrome c3 family protein, partial [Phycisphaerae bacterium]|nr:cytochrome c3 family protein [Phycisphaerae bacterium]